MTPERWQRIRQLFDDVAGLAASEREARLAGSPGAEQRSADIRKLASTTLFEIYDAVRAVPGNTAASALVVKRSTEYLDRLEADDSDDPELWRELARAYERLGFSLSASSGGGVVGDTAAAQRSFERALALQQRVIARAGIDDDLRELAAIQMRLSEVLQTQRRAQPALEQARASPASASSVHSTERRARTQLAASYQTLAFVLNASEDIPGALAAVRAQRAVLEELSTRIRGDVELESARIGALRQEGGVLTTAGDFTTARVVLESAVAAGAQFVAAHPSRIYRRSHSLAENSLGNALHGEKNYEAALLHYERSLALRETLLREDPLDADAAWLVLAAHSERLECLEHLGRYDEALANIESVHAAGERLAARDPNDATVATKLAAYESNVADVFDEKGDRASARKWIAKALHRLEALSAAGRLSDPSTLTDLAERAQELKANP